VLQSGLPLPVPGPYGPEGLLTMPAIWTFMGGVEGMCVHLPAGKDKPKECKKTDIVAGVMCQSAACGRPDDWPAGKPFYIPIDLTDTATWETYILGVRAARQAAGKPTELSEAEKMHVKVGALSWLARGCAGRAPTPTSCPGYTHPMPGLPQ
jgi:hypothetical protein